MTISFSYIYRETIKFKRLIKSHSASSQLSRLCDGGFSPSLFSKTCTTWCWKKRVVSVQQRTSRCRTFDLCFA